jgi:oligoribonuclease (3'-5' exoribonuclease)
MNTNLPDERLVFVDLETAGLKPWRPIIEIAAIAVDGNLRELERFEAMTCPREWYQFLS